MRDFARDELACSSANSTGMLVVALGARQRACATSKERARSRGVSCRQKLLGRHRGNEFAPRRRAGTWFGTPRTTRYSGTRKPGAAQAGILLRLRVARGPEVRAARDSGPRFDLCRMAEMN